MSGEFVPLRPPSLGERFKALLQQWPLFLLSFFLVLLTSAQTVSLPLWVGSFLEPGHGMDPKFFSGPYVILFFTSLALALAFGVLAVITYFAAKRPPPLPLSENWGLLFGVALSMALNGLFLVYASPPDRTPEILQAILLNTGFLWSIPASKLLVEEKSRYKFCQPAPLVAVGCVVWGTVISMIPLIISVWNSTAPIFSTSGQFLWTVVFLISVAPAAISNVFQEKILRRREGCEGKNDFFDIIVLNFWGTLIQFFILVALFWLDIIPGFGFSTTPGHTAKENLHQFFTDFNATAHCFFSPMECANTLWLGFIFFLSFFIQNMVGSALSAESANYVNIAMTLATPVCTLFWIVFPVLNTSPIPAPLWSTLPALFLLVIGSILWKVWEKKEQERVAELMQQQDEQDYLIQRQDTHKSVN